MKKILGLVLVLVLVAVGVGSWLYPRFYSPIYRWEVNIPVNESLATSKLIAADGTVYWENKEADVLHYRFGRQVGRTAEGMRIHEIRGDRAHNELMLTGFMFPAIVYQEESLRPAQN